MNAIPGFFSILLDYLYSSIKQENKVEIGENSRKGKNKIFGINKCRCLDRQYTKQKISNVFMY